MRSEPVISVPWNVPGTEPRNRTPSISILCAMTCRPARSRVAPHKTSTKQAQNKREMFMLPPTKEEERGAGMGGLATGPFVFDPQRGRDTRYGRFEGRAVPNTVIRAEPRQRRRMTGLQRGCKELQWGCNGAARGLQGTSGPTNPPNDVVHASQLGGLGGLAGGVA